MLSPKFLYLAVDFLTIIFPLIFSFYPKANFSRKWKYLWVAILIPGAIFIAWDAWFTRLEVWGFDRKFLSGIFFGNLPLEEVLFFICIPYACVFVYEAANHLMKRDYLAGSQKNISLVLIFICTLTGLWHTDNWYTSVTLLSLAGYLTALQFWLKVTYLGRFYISFIFILLPFFLVNGILTGLFTDDPIVWYNDAENLQIRIGTIPIEDLFYGMLLFLMNVSIFEAMQRGSLGAWLPRPVSNSGIPDPPITNIP